MTAEGACVGASAEPDAGTNVHPLASMTALAALTAGDVMSRSPVAIRAHESLLSAWELLTRGGFRHLPVVGSDGRCLGLVDDRTVIGELGLPTLTHRLVSDVMPPRVHCVLPETRLRDVARIMVRESATGVPVIDPGHRLLGIVTDRDLVALIAGET